MDSGQGLTKASNENIIGTKLEAPLVSFRDLIYPPITLAGFQSLRAKDPKRICFGSVHKNALKDNPSGKSAGFFNVPFSETIGTLFPWELFPNKNGKYGGYYRTVINNDEYDKIGKWMSENSDVVFIRSLFNTAVAACEHYVSPQERSKIGELEHSAKYEGSLSARNKIVGILTEIFSRMHGARRLDGIVSVPASKAGGSSLPNALAAALSAAVNVPDLTSELSWNGKKGSIKELGVDEKWAALEEVGMTIGEGISGKNLLLIDDMYQSGATAHFVASQLRAAGANDLHLLAVSKGRRDTDNT
ncbi:MAG: phosphoribosyltransferase [Candidatus Andeanibacterium colombiense]|uniref:Phosphoribosyltransferase n=1 Tax=Candidatus Andeanibacterium colombiense TaxID=3121345 RepID=A0AAJ5X8G7_9SPHN|nr:MAG: phosphoribosyltransferase [Sphingomonadaceae bacterium]